MARQEAWEGGLAAKSPPHSSGPLHSQEYRRHIREGHLSILAYSRAHSSHSSLSCTSRLCGRTGENILALRSGRVAETVDALVVVEAEEQVKERLRGV